MSKIIEIIGPRGVGKSFIYKKLMTRFRNNKLFAPAPEFYPNSIDSKFLSKDYIIFYARYLFGKKIFPKKNGYIFAKNNPKFIAACWKLLSKNMINDHKGIDSRFRIAKNLYSYHAKYQTIMVADDNRVCITDELLLHTIVQLTKEFDTKDIEDFATVVPLPEFVVYLHAPHDVIFKRIKNRNTILTHDGISNTQLNNLIDSERKNYSTLNKYIKKRGAKIIDIDTTRNVDSNLELIEKKLLGK